MEAEKRDPGNEIAILLNSVMTHCVFFCTFFKYVGTFAVSLGSSGDGEATLTTHKERTKFVKKKLREYRVC